MRQIFSVTLQTVLLLVVAFGGFLLGATVPALRVSHVVSQTATNLRTYDFDWLIAVLLVYVILLLIGAVRKRLLTSGISASVALLLTIIIVVFFTHLGVKNTPM